MEGECNALHLKPNVTISWENNLDIPKEDHAIRPYKTSQLDMCVEQSSFSESQMDHDTVCHTKTSEWNPENSSASVGFSSYQLLILWDDYMSCGIVIAGNAIFYGNCQYTGFDDVEKPGEAHLEWKQNNVWRGEISGERSSHSDSSEAYLEHLHLYKYNEAHFIHLQQESLELKLLSKSLKIVLKVSGKQQRRKKLGDLLGTFDTFHFVNPAQHSWVAFPISKQAIILSQHSSEREGSMSSEPPSDKKLWPTDFIYYRPLEDFSHELYRLGTFANLPADFPVFALSLAQSGFICLPDGAIICYFCRVRRDRWIAGESPWEVHRQLNPSCPMLTGVNCSNVPVVRPSGGQLRTAMEFWSLPEPSVLSGAERDPGVQATSGGSTSSQAFIYSDKLPNQRLFGGLQQTTFAGAQVSSLAASAAAVSVLAQAANNISSNGLANQNLTERNSENTGSNQTGHNSATDRSPNGTQLPVTSGLEGTSSDSTPVAGRPIFDGTAEPEIPSSNASSVRTPPVPPEIGGSVSRTVTYQQLGITTDAPKRVDMATVSARLATFGSWPSSHTQTPQALAEAGFYYAGYADCGRCFQCGGGLKNWEASDDPWVEHARWFDRCQYIKQYQGQDFIDIVTELNHRSETERPEISMEQVKEEMRSRHCGWYHEPSVDPAIAAVQSVGYSQEDVERAAQRFQIEGNQLTSDRLVEYLEAEEAAMTGDMEHLEAVEYDLNEQVESLVTENSELRQQRVCKICLDKEVSQVFLPCGHLVCCASCSPPLRACPVCRQRIKGRVRAFPAV